MKSTLNVTHVRLQNSTSLEFLKSFDRKRTIITLKERRKWPKASRSVSVGRWNYSVHVFCISLLVACTLQNPTFFRCTWLGSCRILILLHSHCMFLAPCGIILLALYEVLICLLITYVILFRPCSISLLLYVHCVWFQPCEILLSLSLHCMLFKPCRAWISLITTHYHQINCSIVHWRYNLVYFFHSFGSSCLILVFAVFRLHVAQTLLNLLSASLYCICLESCRILVLLC